MERPGTYKETSESPARNSYPVTPHDSNEIGAFEPKALWVGSGGTIVGQLVGDTEDRTFSGVPSGALLPLKFRIIKSTGTSASALVALY